MSPPRWVRIAAGLALAAWVVWCAAAVWLGGVGPDSIPAVRAAIGALCVAAAGASAWRGHPWAGVTAVCLLVTGGYASLRPSHDRAWTEDQSRLPQVRIEGDRAIVTDARAFRYRASDDWDAAWYDATYPLDRIEGVDFAVERFTENEAVAHTLVSFRFEDGQILAISAEIRKERGEGFGPVRGLFRQYELMYVLGDERDLLELRTVHRRDDVYLHPMRATPEQARAFLESLLRATAELYERPRFYHTVQASCTSTLAQHLRTVADLPLDHRVYLPGYSDALAFELGLIDTDVDFAATRERHHINARADAAAGSEGFSAAIRAR